MPLASGIRLGSFEVLSLIGAGPMAEVYLARDVRAGTIVALKVLPAHLSAHPQLRAWLEREGRIASRLVHPSICRLLDVGHADGGIYVAMEYLEGESLAIRLVRGSLATRQALAMAREVTAALEAAHAMGVVHAVLKPANVMLSNDGGVKVLDFGLAHATADRAEGAAATTHEETPAAAEAQSGFVFGTPAYMSPEQSRGEPVDPRTDLWALGVVLFESLSGTSPFLRPSALETMRAIQEEDPNWRALPAAVAGSTRALIRRALERDPSMRWPSAREMGAAIEAARGA